MLAERARQCVAALEIGGGAAPRVTISLGIASYSQGRSKEALIEAADAALYKAKRSGRNRVRVAEEAPDVEDDAGTPLELMAS